MLKKVVVVVTVLGCSTNCLAGEISEKIPFFGGGGVKAHVSHKIEANITLSRLIPPYIKRIGSKSETKYMTTMIDGTVRRTRPLGYANLKGFGEGGVWRLVQQPFYQESGNEAVPYPANYGYGVTIGGGISCAFLSRGSVDISGAYRIPFTFMKQNFVQRPFFCIKAILTYRVW